MSNPFDDSIADQYQNPFANNDAPAEMPAPAPAPAPPQATQSYSPPVETQPTYSQQNINLQSNNNASSSFSGGNRSSDFRDPATNLKVSEADLAKREEALARREREIESKEQQIRSGTYTPVTSRKNFPPFLRWYSYHPDEDLPESARTQAKILFFVYLAIGFLYLLNWFGCLCCLNKSASQATSSPATKIVLSTVFLFAFYPLSYEVSYFVYYKALAEGKALRFVCFLATYIIWGLFLAFNAIGIEESGSIGWIQTIDLFSATGGGAKFVAVVGLIFSLGSTGLFAFMVYMLLKLIKYYKTEGLEKRTYAEASQYAAQKANENRDTIIQAARENPELVAGAARTAANGYASID